jgi:hypothetical protein
VRAILVEPFRRWLRQELTVAELQDAVHNAIQLEFSTIPPIYAADVRSIATAISTAHNTYRDESGIPEITANRAQMSSVMSGSARPAVWNTFRLYSSFCG